MDRKTYNKLYYQQNKEREKKRSAAWFKENPEKARELRRARATRNRQNPEWVKRNREYQREWARKWRKKNPDKVKAQTKSEANKVRQAKYRANHKKEISRRNIAYIKKQMNINPYYRLKNALRTRIHCALKRKKGKKAYKTMEMIGCSIPEYIKHIERQFTPEMTWNNRGKVWDIDHIIPIDLFDLNDPQEQKKAFHFTNTQPLNCLENRKKGNRLKI